ncbi:MAG: preprotein translocase subunit YajC [Bacteroidota bacterium]|jgi:preprotein translocase subunit YajC
MNTLFITLQAAGGGSAMQQIIPIALIMIVFYFFMIRPQTKKQKLEREFKDSLKEGERVVTIGGVHGKITSVKEKTFIIEIAKDVRVEVEKTAISAEVTKSYSTNIAK